MTKEELAELIEGLNSKDDWVVAMIRYKDYWCFHSINCGNTDLPIGLLFHPEANDYVFTDAEFIELLKHANTLPIVVGNRNYPARNDYPDIDWKEIKRNERHWN